MLDKIRFSTIKIHAPEQLHPSSSGLQKRSNALVSFGKKERPREPQGGGASRKKEGERERETHRERDRSWAPGRSLLESPMRHPGVVKGSQRISKVINRGYLQATHQLCRRDTANQKPRCWSQYNLREHQLDLPRKDRKGRGAYPKSAIFDGKIWKNEDKPWDDGILWDFGVPNSPSCEP